MVFKVGAGRMVIEAVESKHGGELDFSASMWLVEVFCKPGDAMRFFFDDEDDEFDVHATTVEDFADYMQSFAFSGPVGAFGQGSITIVDAGRLLIDFSESGDGPGEVFRESRKVYVQIIAAIADLDEPQFGDALRRLAHRYWAEGEAMAIARMAAPAAPRPHSTL